MEELIPLITDAILRFGYVAVFLLMVVESACIPVPSEVTMLFGGALANATFVQSVGGREEPLGFWTVVALGTLGNLVGSWIAYWFGARAGRTALERYGGRLLGHGNGLARAEGWWADRGGQAVFVGRLLPVIRTFISLPAGIARMPLGRFTVYTTVGCLPWVFALTAAGYGLGERWETVERLLRPASIAIAVALAIWGGWWIARRVAQSRATRAG